MRIIEFLLVVTFLVGFTLRMFLVPNTNLIILISLIFLSFLYFGLGILIFNHIGIRDVLKKNPFNEVSKLKILGSILCGVNLSILVIGILFGLLHWPGYKLMVMVSLPPALIILFIVIVKVIKTSKSSYTKVISRSLIFIPFATILLINPLFFDEISLRNHPEEIAMIRARIKYNENPTEENRLILEAAEDKLNNSK